ncbi:DUF5999 family protein [Streptomyces viridosporus]|uniref:DUF5999 family protein n=1 Tax=Streptomyces viridosporus TaxID=67581 RepID=UPI003D9E0F82
MSFISLSRTPLTGQPPNHTPNSPRSSVASATETISLVLDEDAPLLDGERDIDDLVLRLRGHLMELGYAAPGRCPAIEKALAAARRLADTNVPAEYVAARVHLRHLAEAVKTVISELAAAGLVCGHWPECPPANAADREAARVRARHPEIGCSELCNGVLVFEDTGCLLPAGEVIGPRRSMPLAATPCAAVTS